MFYMNINVVCGIFQWNGKFILTGVLLKHSKHSHCSCVGLSYIIGT